MPDAVPAGRTAPDGPPLPDAESGTGEAPGPAGSHRPVPRWQPDVYRDPTAERPVIARRVRRGCWLLVVILLLICCVLSAWLTDSILDLRTITTGA